MSCTNPHLWAGDRLWEVFEPPSYSTRDLLPTLLQLPKSWTPVVLQHSTDTSSGAPSSSCTAQVQARNQPWGQVSCFPPGPSKLQLFPRSPSPFECQGWHPLPQEETGPASEVGSISLTTGWERLPTWFLSYSLPGGLVPSTKHAQAQAKSRVWVMSITPAWQSQA